MSAPVQAAFRKPAGGTSAGTSGTALRPTSGSTSGPTSAGPGGGGSGSPATAPRKRSHLNVEDWVIVAMLALALAIATSAAAVDGSTSARAAAAPAEASAPDTPAAPAPSGTGCTVKDPTGGRCVTPTTAHGLDELAKVFGPYRNGPTIRSAGCWDAHAWNPTSDHPKGKGCDLFPGPSGQFAKGAALDAGWAVAKWLRANAGPLKVNYVIWQGRIWSIERPNDVGGGWGRRYTGGGIYNPNDPTGGHFDHVHVSFRE